MSKQSSDVMNKLNLQIFLTFLYVFSHDGTLTQGLIVYL